MGITIGDNIRKYRKEKEISQETLAERLGVTFQAVSRWERGEGYPDISMLPVIAGFFHISVDELLGISENRQEEEVEKIIEKCSEYDTHYEAEKMQSCIDEALKKYPGNFKLLGWYVYAFQRANSLKAIEAGAYVLNNCHDEEIRGFVRRNLVYAYRNSGQFDKAVEIAKQLPSYYDTRQDVLRDMLSGKERLEHVQHMCIDLAYEFWYSVRKIQEEYSADERIALFQKSNDIYDAIYEKDDMPIKLSRKMRNYQGMAEVALEKGRVKEGLTYMTKAAECARMHDCLPEKVYSECMLFNCHPYDRSWEAKTCIKLKKELLSDFETEDEFYGEIRNEEAYRNLIASLKEVI